MSHENDHEGWFSPSYGFGALPAEWTDPETSKIVLLPIPYETSTTYGAGCRKGPAAIIEASTNMETYDEDLECEPCEIGVHTLPPLEIPDDAGEMIGLVDTVATAYLDRGKFVTALGGEHTVSLGMIRALRRRHKALSVLYLDAHADFRQSYRGNEYSHACAAKRIEETCHIVQAGVRSLSREEAVALEEKKIKSFRASEFRRTRGGGARGELIGRVVDELQENVYISVDADVFDPSIMPAVGTPEPGGLLWDETLDLLREVVGARNLVGLDLVELAPVDGIAHPQFLAARLLQKVWGYAFGA
jgi:agmatinase